MQIANNQSVTNLFWITFRQLSILKLFYLVISSESCNIALTINEDALRRLPFVRLRSHNTIQGALVHIAQSLGNWCKSSTEPAAVILAIEGDHISTVYKMGRRSLQVGLRHTQHSPDEISQKTDPSRRRQHESWRGVGVLTLLSGIEV